MWTYDKIPSLVTLRGVTIAMADLALESAIFHDRGLVLARAVRVGTGRTKGEMAELLMNSANVRLGPLGSEHDQLRRPNHLDRG